MIRFIVAICVCLVFFGSFTGQACAQNEEYSAEQIEFFEKRIRPLLINHCLECHGAKKAENELRLDSRQAILKGGSTDRPAAIPGDAQHSLMINSVRQDGDYDMPPNGKLTDEEILDLATWVQTGMAWPTSSSTITATSMSDLIKQHQETHWAFQPIVTPEVPTFDQSKNPIDQFVSAKLESKGLAHSPPADRRTLIRRSSFDLLGLPPTYDDVQSFINDDSENAYEKLVDRLLDSPHYGERWARHWLDVARYSDTSGYTLDNVDNRFPFAFTYRDYVIDALNSDLPYDQFIREQLAADYLEVPADKKTLAALGFITVGRKYLGRPDTIDDQVDVVTRGLMGLTLSCARCHDHKYDAIPTQDYYSLYGVFANNYEPSELPLLGSTEDLAKFEPYFENLTQLKTEIETFRASKLEELTDHIQSHFVDYLAHVMLPDNVELIERQPFIKLKGPDVRRKVVEHWKGFLANKHDDTALIKPTLELLALPDEQFESAAAKLIGHWSTHPNESKINALFLEALNANPPKQKLELAQIMGRLFDEVVEEWKSNGSKAPAPNQFSGPRRQIANLVLANRSPARLTNEQLDRYLNVAEQKEIRKLRDAVNQHNSESPEGLARAMILRDKETLIDQHVFRRGNIHSRGELAPRRFVALLSSDKLINYKPSESVSDARPIFQRKSGRLELAEKIASRDNPLTARVLVNRVWMHHFSQPLVDTPSDFGIRCSAPVQRELLDYLASEFMRNGWSIKWLHREIMNSKTYRQSSLSRSDCQTVDPENRLYWRMNRRRLEFEPLRDSVLATTQQIDLKMHGKPIELMVRPLSNRRTIYGLIDRQDLPGLYRVFDLASPDQSAAKRIRTTVPQQSLFMMNSFFMTHQARHLVNTMEGMGELDLPDKVTSLYRTVYQREPTAGEIEIARNFFRTAEPKSGDKNLGPWQRYAQMLLCANEFEFID